MDTGQQMAQPITLRPGQPEDAAALGQICYDAFKTISEAHGFPPDFESTEQTVGFMQMMLSLPPVYSVAAEDRTGKLVGSNFLWKLDAVSGIGPITVDPGAQNSSIGRRLMEDVIAHSDSAGHVSVRLVQAAFHNRSLSLYTKLGFDTVEPLSGIGGTPPRVEIAGHAVRPMTIDDIAGADDLCRRVHGFARHNETTGAIQRGEASVVEHDGRVTGYTTGIGMFGHAVGESNEDIKALIGAAAAIAGPGFLLPTRNGELMRWCLGHGLKVVQPLTLMSRGLYQEPRGAFIPSILF